MLRTRTYADNAAQFHYRKRQIALSSLSYSLTAVFHATCTCAPRLYSSGTGAEVPTGATGDP